MARFACRSARIEQLQPSGPTGSVSTCTRSRVARRRAQIPWPDAPAGLTVPPMLHPAVLALAVVASALAVGAGIFVYVAASFALMRAHVERRPVARVLREALRELGWALLTQPLLPLF